MHQIEGTNGNPVIFANRLLRVDLPPPVLPKTATLFIVTTSTYDELWMSCDGFNVVKFSKYDYLILVALAQSCDRPFPGDFSRQKGGLLLMIHLF
ncbi:MAG: hypothetical protein F6K16_36270 [Symploca sp. SIO2B6]|nr:hypothetical protein [Symploca sp. SIO2B6]